MTELDNIVAQLERQRAAIDRALEALQNISGGSSATPAAGKRRGRTSEGRQRQIEAMRRYWAAKKAGKTGGKTAGKKATPAKRSTGLTAAGRKKLSENMRKRWAAKRATSKSAA